MKCRGWAVVLAMALAACGDAADTPATEATVATASSPTPQPSASASVAEGPRAIRCFTAGELEGVPAPAYDHSILAFGDSLFAGYGLCPDQGYPEKLQAALARRGGIDAQ